MNGETHNWIDEICIARKSLFSNAVLIETDDSRRITELLERRPDIALTEKAKKKYDLEEHWIVLDCWEGISECTLEGKKAEKGQPTDCDAIQQYGLRSVLPKISKEIHKGATVLVITNLFKTDDIINSAIRGWSTSDQLRLKDSSILIFVDDRSVFPPEVWTHMKIVKPKKSTWEERKERIQLLQEELLDKKTKINEKEFDDVIRLTAGMNLDQVESAIIETILTRKKIDVEVLAKTKASIIAKDPIVDIIQRPNFGFEAIGGYDALKQRIIDDVVLPMRHPEMAKRYCMKPPRGIILFGPPGTGKTILVKSLGKELNMSIIRLCPENILGMYVGQSEKSLRKAFDIADSMAPVIVFIDEIDRFSKRGEGENVSSHVERELFSMLLEKLGDENREWFFAAATNMIESIDSAMRRTGRIDTVMPVPYPDEKAREEIFKIHTSIKRQLPLKDDIDTKEIAKKTYMWSGSDIEQLVIRTANHVMKEDIKCKDDLFIGMDEFIEILNTFNIPVEQNEKLQEQTMQQAKLYTNDTRLGDIFEQAQKTDLRSGKITKGKQMMED